MWCLVRILCISWTERCHEYKKFSHGLEYKTNSSNIKYRNTHTILWVTSSDKRELNSKYLREWLVDRETEEDQEPRGQTTATHRVEHEILGFSQNRIVSHSA